MDSDQISFLLGNTILLLWIAIVMAVFLGWTSFVVYSMWRAMSAVPEHLRKFHPALSLLYLLVLCPPGYVIVNWVLHLLLMSSYDDAFRARGLPPPANLKTFSIVYCVLASFYTIPYLNGCLLLPAFAFHIVFLVSLASARKQLVG